MPQPQGKSVVIELRATDLETAQRDLSTLLPFAKSLAFGGRHWVICGETMPADTFAHLPYVANVHYIDVPYPLASKEFCPRRTIVRVGNIPIGAGLPVIMAGPCSVEHFAQLFTTATHLAQKGCHILRGGAFKPRTSPYSFQGLGHEGLKLLAEVRSMTGLPFVTEVLNPQDVDLVASYADMLQIGARNMQNFPLLREVARSQKPILLKRAPWATLSTWLQAAEYILVEGNFQVVLCERGICTSAAAAGCHLDLTAIQQVLHISHLPVIADPSHGTGMRSLVTPMAIAALLAGADGIIVETHPEPDKALSDSKQTLSFDEFDMLMDKYQRLVPNDMTLSQPAYVY
jgi:3-deoxy-7-phosphoheptulonate synthase